MVLNSPICAAIRELKQLLRRPQRRLQKNNRLNDQNNSSARASRFLVHFFNVHCTTTTWNFLICRFTYDDEFSFLYLKLNKILKNSTSREKSPAFWRIERVQRRDQVWKNANSLFYRRFYCRRRHHRCRGGHFRNFWVGMCRWDPWTLNLYQS